jgi:hypothetical protein
VFCEADFSDFSVFFKILHFHGLFYMKKCPVFNQNHIFINIPLCKLTL